MGVTSVGGRKGKLSQFSFRFLEVDSNKLWLLLEDKGEIKKRFCLVFSFV